MNKGFGDLFSESWKEFRENFRYFFLVLFLFMFVPSIISYFVSLPWTITFARLGENPSFEIIMEAFSENIGFFLLSFLIGIITFLVSVFAYASLTYGVLNKKKLIDFKSSLVGGKKNYFRYLGFSVVTTIFLTGLTILFIIPGIIFGVFWCFASFILIKEGKGIMDSLRESHRLVKGRWWKTFGFLILIFLVMFLITLIPFIVAWFINILINPAILPVDLANTTSTIYYSSLVWYVNDIISLIASFVGNIVGIPLLLLFLKNLYLDRKK